MAVQCINVQPETLLNLYKTPVRIDYDIKRSSVANKFTVLDALNILFEKFINISFDRDDNNDQEMNMSNLNKLHRTKETNMNFVEQLQESSYYSRNKKDNFDHVLKLLTKDELNRMAEKDYKPKTKKL